LASDGIPAVALDAYRKAAAHAAKSCGIPWPLLAAIGRVESDHGRFADSQLYSDGTSAPRVIGIPLNGNGTALITDTDHGALDGDTVYDRAVGPMQFIPSTWATWGVDGNGDHVVSPFNIYDAAFAAAAYLCSAGGNLGTADGQIRAVLAYNHSDEYLALVLGLEKVYATGVPGVTIPILPSDPKPKPNPNPLPPPVDPGQPRGIHPVKKPNKPPATHPGSSTPPPTSGSDAAPIAALAVTQTSDAALDVVASAAGSTDDRGITGYGFDFGDGTALNTPTSAVTANHTYAKAGTYTVTVTVTDAAGHRSTKTGTLTVDRPPTAGLTAAPKAEGSLVFVADASTSTDDEVGIVSYTFDFGDGTVLPAQPDAKAEHTYVPGAYTVKVTVTDAAGKSAIKTFDVTVAGPSTSTSSSTDTPSAAPST
jgi:PKD repeat protein